MSGVIIIFVASPVTPRHPPPSEARSGLFGYRGGGNLQREALTDPWTHCTAPNTFMLPFPHFFSIDPGEEDSVWKQRILYLLRLIMSWTQGGCCLLTCDFLLNSERKTSAWLMREVFILSVLKYHPIWDSSIWYCIAGFPTWGLVKELQGVSELMKS